MAFSEVTRTCTYLDQFADFFGIDIYVFNDVNIANCIPNAAIGGAKFNCAAFNQFDWQNSSAISIERIALLLEQAEEAVQAWLPFDICNNFHIVKQDLPFHYQKEYGPRVGIGTKIILDTKCIRELGTPVLTLLDTAQVIPSTVVNNYSDRFTATFNLGANFDEKNLDYLYVTRSGFGGDTLYKVLATVEAYAPSTKQLTVSVDFWNMINLDEIFDRNILRDRGHDICGIPRTTYDTELELWGYIVDPKLTYANLVCKGSKCGNNPNCEVVKTPVCLNVVDCANGIVEIAGFGTTDENGVFAYSTCPTDCYWPEQIEITLRSGCQCKQILTRDNIKKKRLDQMCPQLQRAIFLVLADLLPIDDCGQCPRLESELRHWQADLALTGGGGSQYSVPQNLLANEFGFTKAAVLAWQIVQSMAFEPCGRRMNRRNI